MIISRIAFFSSGVIDGLQMDGLTVGLGAALVVGINGGPSVSDSIAAATFSSGSCTALLLCGAWRKVTWNDGLAQFRMMRSELLVMAASSRLDQCDLVLRLSWLVASFLFSGFWFGLEAYFLHRCAFSNMKVIDSLFIDAYRGTSRSGDQ